MELPNALKLEQEPRLVQPEWLRQLHLRMVQAPP